MDELIIEAGESRDNTGQISGDTGNCSIFWRGAIFWSLQANRHRDCLALLRPLLVMLVFTVVFSRIAKLPSEGTAPYSLLVFAGCCRGSFSRRR